MRPFRRSRPTVLPALWLAAWALLLGLLGPARAADEARLRLADAERDLDAWPVATMLAETGAPLSVAQVLTRLGEFQPPRSPHANLGVRREAVWLRVPLAVPQTENGRWMLDIDYPSLDRVEVHVVTDGLVVRSSTVGREIAFHARPVAARSHLLPLVLEAGQEHELLLRVKTSSSMVVPLRLMKQDAYSAREASVQMVQGLMTGIGLCLVLYSLAHWASLRDASFLYYAISVAGVTLFFFSYYGLGPQHLWSGSAWLTVNMAPFIVLVALLGGLLFLERTLAVAEISRRMAWMMKALAVLAGAGAAGFALGLIDYRSAQALGTVLGPTPILLGLPAAYLRLKRGDRVALYVLLGWGLYAVGIVTMALLLRGLVDYNVWTQHAFQAGAMLEMVMWLRVLGVRMQEMRHFAERVGREREALRSLAHTDALTGLPNRRGLQLEMGAALPRATPEQLLAVYLLDLDGFKAVNDRHGHDAGDELLKAVAARLRSHLRVRDVVARLGGDEFVVMAADLAADEDARRLGAKLLDGFEQPFMVRGQLCRVGLTIGYALAPFDGRDEVSLLKRADAAMYAGKQAGKHCLRRGQASVGLSGA